MIAFKSHFWHKKLSFCDCYGRNNVSRKSVNPLVIYQFYCMAFFHSQTQRHNFDKCVKGNTTLPKFTGEA